MFPPLVILISVTMVTAMRGGLHRIAGAVAVIVLLFNIAMNEQEIYSTIESYGPTTNPVETSLQNISASSGPGPVPVYLEPDADLGHFQDWFSTAEMLGNVVLKKGGKAAFLNDPAPAARMVEWDGRITHH